MSECFTTEAAPAMALAIFVLGVFIGMVIGQIGVR